ncbi:MAG: hypothetical protein V1664_02505 [Candidatus Uhrbacteria bacterium]
MALYATHLRFAHELVPFLEIKDLSAYYSGVTYPDSRNMTKLERHKTHDLESLRDPFKKELDDFSKGWAIHNLYDEKSEDFYVKTAPWPDEELMAPNRLWLYTTAEKVVEDQISFNILGQTLPLIIKKIVCPAKSPNDEDHQLLENFYSLMIKSYQRRSLLTFEDYQGIFIGCGSSSEMVKKIAEFTEQIMAEPEKVRQITGFYDRILKSVLEKYQV